MLVPVQIDEDDTLWVIYQPFQLSGLVPQLLGLCGADRSYCTNTQQLTSSVLHAGDIQHRAFDSEQTKKEGHSTQLVRLISC